MYVVFIAPESNNKQADKANKLILEMIRAEKHTTIDGTFPYDQTLVEDHAAQLTRDIKKADAVIVEATHSNFNLGRFITLAIQQHKPILILQEKNQGAPLVIGTTRLVSIKQYVDLSKEVPQLLNTFFKVSKKQRLTYRFNLMLSREINRHLMDKARSQGLSKADYIRELILGDMAD